MSFFSFKLPHPLLSAFTLGVFGAYGMGPFYFWPAMMVSLSLFWLVLTSYSDKPSWKAALCGFLFGFGYFTGGLWWIGNALLIDGSPYMWALPLAVCGLPALLALFPTLAAFLIRRLFAGRCLSSFAAYVALMFAAEYARGHLFTGFPWNLFGMSWTSTLPMLQILSLGGVYLLSFLTIFMFSVPAFAWKGNSSRTIRYALVMIALALGIISYAYGFNRLNQNPTIYNTDVLVQLVQPSIPQEDKWNWDKMWDNTRKTISLIESNPSHKGNDEQPSTRVVILPETALTYHHLSNQAALDALTGHLRGYPEDHVYLATGLLQHDGVRYHNSLAVMDRSGHILTSFDKFHLVPFGEYIPLQKLFPFGPIARFSGFETGSGPHTLSVDGVPPFSPLVCYEVIFPSEVTARDEKHPSWMLNVTNDAWYGISPGPFQHLAQAQYRAIEEGIPIVRVANTGISGIFDSYGRPVLLTGLFSESNNESYLPLPAAKETPYARLRDLY